MALLFMDGFDIYTDRADVLLTGHGWLTDGAAAQTDFSTTGGRYGGGALTNVGGSNFTWRYQFPTDLAQGTTLIIQFFYKSNDSTDASPETLVSAFSASGIAAFNLTQQGTNGDLVLVPNGGASQTMAGALPADGLWHDIRIKVTFGTTASNGSVEIRVDGTTYGPFTGLDTQVGASLIRDVRFGGLGSASVATAFFDDIIIMDTAGTRLNDFIEPARIVAFGATADGGVVAWTASVGTNVSCVDEALAAHNGDVDFISSSTAAQESRFAMGDLTETPTVLHAVQVRCNAKQQVAGDTYRGLMNSGGIEQVGDTLTPPAAYAWNRNLIQMTDPATAASWTKSGVDALQVGAEIVTAGGGSTRISTIAMEVLRSVQTVALGTASAITCVISSS